MSMIKEFIQDSTALGGLPIYVFTMLFFLLTEYRVNAYRLFAGLVLCYSITILVRAMHFKWRPDKQDYSNWIEKIDASSLPSLHSMRAVVLFGTLAYFFASPLAWMLSILGMFAVGGTRILLSRHYLTDVLAGAGIGVIILVIVLSV